MNRQLTAAVADPALQRLACLGSCEPACLLHSGRRHNRWARQSWWGKPDAWYRFWGPGEWEWEGDSAPDLHGDPWEDLRHLLAGCRPQEGWIGCLSYDLGRLLEPGKLRAPRRGRWPLIELGRCRNLERLTPETPGTPGTPGEKKIRPVPADVHSIPDLHSNFSAGGYARAVQAALDKIAAGDVFQVNLAQTLRCAFDRSSLDLYRHLAAQSPAWYGAYFKFPDGRAVCSASPELFLALEDRRVLTRPIKGTLPGDTDPALLENSTKDQAELHMIVDLMRNDLGRVCQFGSVRVEEARAIETHPTVHQATATLSGTLRDGCDTVDLLKACLPGGSITGAPKVRAMQIIDELEPEDRGPYCGAIGLLRPDFCSLSMAIRTIWVDPAIQEARFAVGAGIVADSDPQREEEETLVKARPLIAALARTLAESEA